MPGIDRRIDPQSGDYIADGSGAWQTTRTAETAIYHQLRAHLGAWWGDPLAGSRLLELARARSLESSPVVLADMMREALAPLVAAGRITEPAIETQRVLDEVIQAVTVIDRQSGESIDVGSLLPFDP